MSVRIRYREVGGRSSITDTLISVIETSQGCEYRLEYKPANPVDWPINEVAGDQGDPQRYTNSTCTPPDFTITEARSKRKFEEQTVYYWTKEAREYAKTYLWITPPGWPVGPNKIANDHIGPDVLKDSFDNACQFTPGSPEGCMRVWPHEGPKIHIKAGYASPELIAHEFGHYAAGFIFGHMDISSIPGSNIGFDPAKCDHRSFNEAIAEMFMSVFLHHARYADYAKQDPLKNGLPQSSFDLSSPDTWDNQCGTTDYVMGRPLVQAFHKTLWDNVWSSPAKANQSMAAAFSVALANNSGYQIPRLAGDILDYLDQTQTYTVSNRAKEIFRAHDFRSIGDACVENVTCSGARTSRCDDTRSPSRCIPDDGYGIDGDYCTHNKHCENLNCVGVTSTTGGVCQPGGNIGDLCETNAGCTGPRTSRCDDTRSPSRCIPDDDEGIDGDYCTHNHHCDNLNCVGVTSTTGGVCQPGGDIGDLCETNAGCTGPRTSRCDDTVSPAKCIPDDGYGRRYDYCTHNNHCDAGQGLVCRIQSGSGPQPGKCDY